jgi:hypothetical protein
MFPLFSREEAEEIMHTITAPPCTTEDASPDLVDKKLAYGELLAMCAVVGRLLLQTSVETCILIVI